MINAIKSTQKESITGKKIMKFSESEKSCEYFPKNNIVKNRGDKIKKIAANHFDFFVP